MFAAAFLIFILMMASAVADFGLDDVFWSLVLALGVTLALKVASGVAKHRP